MHVIFPDLSCLNDAFTETKLSKLGGKWDKLSDLFSNIVKTIIIN